MFDDFPRTGLHSKIAESFLGKKVFFEMHWERKLLDQLPLAQHTHTHTHTHTNTHTHTHMNTNAHTRTPIHTLHSCTPTLALLYFLITSIKVNTLLLQLTVLLIISKVKVFIMEALVSPTQTSQV